MAPVVGIKQYGSGKITVSGGQFKNLDVGIETAGADLSIEDTNFENVTQPVKVSGGSVQARNVTSDLPQVEPSTESGSRRRVYGGWEPPTGPRVPCCCASCGSIFASRSFTIFNAGFHSFGNVETCPICRQLEGRVAIGLFEIAHDVVRLISGPEVTSQQLKFLQSLSTALNSGEIGVTEAIAEAETSFPSLAASLKMAVGWGVAAATLIVTIAGGYQDIPPTVHDLREWIGEVIEKTTIEGKSSPSTARFPPQ